MHNLQKLLQAGQSVWLDNIHREMLENGQFKALIDREEIRGVTSNPTIFMNAITKSANYDASMAAQPRDRTAEEVFWALAIQDIQQAADLLSDLYQRTNGGDGYASLEVNPNLAEDSAGTLEQALSLMKQVDKPNLMIKIPATARGIPAIAAATEAGININVTLIFGRERYREVMEAYLSGLERRIAVGKPVDHIASVASFFVSRLDSLLDPQLEKAAPHLAGKMAIANARLAYADYKEVFEGARFAALKAKGAREQRPLWASTSTKNPKYRDVLYIEELIGPGTVNTIPPQTMEAFLDHGRIRPSLEEDLEGARTAFNDLQRAGISMLEATRKLEADGVKSFSESYAILLKAVGEKRRKL